MSALSIYLSYLYKIFLTSVFLSPALYIGWNQGVAKFLPICGQVEWRDCMLILAAFQILSSFTVRKRDVTYIPVYLPVETKVADKNNE